MAAVLHRPSTDQQHRAGHGAEVQRVETLFGPACGREVPFRFIGQPRAVPDAKCERFDPAGPSLPTPRFSIRATRSTTANSTAGFATRPTSPTWDRTRPAPIARISHQTARNSRSEYTSYLAQTTWPPWKPGIAGSLELLKASAREELLRWSAILDDLAAQAQRRSKRPGSRKTSGKSESPSQMHFFGESSW